jgi:hypothetical protein
MMRPHDEHGNLIQRRPAETSGGVAMSAAMLIAWLLDAPPEVLVPLAIVLGFVPAAVTWAVTLWRRG